MFKRKEYALYQDLEDVREDLDAMKASIYKMEKDTGEIKTEIGTAITLFKWAGVAIATTIPLITTVFEEVKDGLIKSNDNPPQVQVEVLKLQKEILELKKK